MRRLVCAALLIATVGSTVAYFAHVSFATASRTDTPMLRFDPYLHRTTGEYADPVNLVFRGADTATVAAMLRTVLGWQYTAGSAMLFQDYGETRPTGQQLGLNLNGIDRYHLRIEASGDGTPRSYVLAAVHLDLGVPCGHVGTDFNYARDLVAQAFAAQGYSVRPWHLDNVLPGRQCDGSLTAGDGVAAVIDLAGHQPQPALFPAGGAASAVYLGAP